LLVHGRPEHLSSSTYTLPALKRECHSKPSVWLKEWSPKSHKAFSFGSGFTQLHAKLDADTLLDFAIHCKQNET
jgi:hypothetical protein